MVFITTGQRIATENFADGVIYKVTFVDTTISYMMCVGIGQDFVMLQGPNPSLFCLTTSSASRVSTIDIHDPTPPEPPTPLDNVLQYQNGEPPFTFTTTTSKLFSWYIEGPCGDETANLYDIATVKSGYYVRAGNTSSTSPLGSEVSNGTFSCSDYIEVEPNEKYTVNYPRISSASGAGAVFFDSSKNAVSGIPLDQQTKVYVFTVPSDCTYIRLSWRNEDGNEVMFVKGEYTAATIPPYEPSGMYKIPISSNSNKTTIYLDAPLGEGEKLYSVNIDTEITTDIGENTLTVDTTDTPNMQIVYDIYAEG